MIKCPNCGKEFEQMKKFCNGCGTPLQPMEEPSFSVCPACNGELEPGSKFCDNCGINLAEYKKAPSAPQIQSVRTIELSNTTPVVLKRYSMVLGNIEIAGLAKSVGDLLFYDDRFTYQPKMAGTLEMVTLVTAVVGTAKKRNSEPLVFKYSEISEIKKEQYLGISLKIVMTLKTGEKYTFIESVASLLGNPVNVDELINQVNTKL